MVNLSKFTFNKKILTAACSFVVGVWVYSLISSSFPYICVCVCFLNNNKKKNIKVQLIWKLNFVLYYIPIEKLLLMQ